MDSPKLGFSTEENSPAPSENTDTFETEEKKKKGRNPVLMMVLVLGVGLLVSLAYLGGRISSAHASVAATKPAAFAEASGAADGDRSLTVAARKEETLATAPAATKAAPASVAAKQVAKSTPANVPVATKEVATVTPAVAPAATKEVAKVTPAAAPVVKTEVTPVVDRSLTVAARKDQVKVAPPAAVEDSAQLFQPKAGVAYVQVGAFVSPYAENWVSVLKQRGFHPVVAEGPNSSVHRVLLGPFGPAEVAEVETKLRTSGIDHFERVY